VAQPQPSNAEQQETRTVDPTFEPLERAGRAINDGIRKDDRFPELDQMVQRNIYSLEELMYRGGE
jgi:predicted subunit of tRNA(5-methylaminomethyl-2-thiouridylate) methyltransferase